MDREEDEDETYDYVQDFTRTLSSSGQSITGFSSPPHPLPAKCQKSNRGEPLVEPSAQEVHITSSPSTSSQMSASDYEGLVLRGLNI